MLHKILRLVFIKLIFNTSVFCLSSLADSFSFFRKKKYTIEDTIYEVFKTYAVLLLK